MKVLYAVLIAIGAVALPFGASPKTMADDTVSEIKAAPAKAAGEIREGIVQTGQIVVQTGQKARKKASETWSIIRKKTIEAGKSIKEGGKNIGQEFKKKHHGTSNNHPDGPNMKNPVDTQN